MKLRQESNAQNNDNNQNVGMEDLNKQLVMRNINEINSHNFRTYISMGIKTLAITILDYHMNIYRIREVLVEYRYNYMHYDQYPTMILKIKMILDYFQKMNIYPSETNEPNQESQKNIKTQLNIDQMKKKVTRLINHLLHENGKGEKTFIEKELNQNNIEKG